MGFSAEENDDFWNRFIIVLSGIPKQDSIFIGSELNGIYVGRDTLGYSGVYGVWDLVQDSCECVPQRRMVIDRFVIRMQPQKKKIVKFGTK